MKTADSQKIVHELAESTHQDEQLVSEMYADAVEHFQHEARIMDYVPLFAAKRVRERLKSRATASA